MKTKRATSMSFNDDDYLMYTQLKKRDVSIISTWRCGANVLLSVQKGKENDMSFDVNKSN